MSDKKAALVNDDIAEEIRLELYRSQYLIRVSEQRAYDLFLQNLVMKNYGEKIMRMIFC